MILSFYKCSVSPRRRERSAPEKEILSAVARDPARTHRASISNPHPIDHAFHWPPLTRGLSAKLTGGESDDVLHHQKNCHRLTTSVGGDAHIAPHTAQRCHFAPVADTTGAAICPKNAQFLRFFCRFAAKRLRILASLRSLKWQTQNSVGTKKGIGSCRLSISLPFPIPNRYYLTRPSLLLRYQAKFA